MLRSNAPSQFLADALPVLEDLIYEELETPPDLVPAVFNMKSTDRWGEQDLTVAGLQAAQETEEGEAVPEDQPIEGYSKTYIPVEYTLMCSFSKTLIEDDRLMLVEDTYRSLGTSMYQAKQIVAFNVINDGYATTTGPDSTYLFSTSHTLIGGGTYANRPSTEIALSIAGLQTMQTSMRRQVNHRNLNVFLTPQTIVLPPELEQTARELIESADRPDTPNRATNVYSGKYKLLISPFLTSTTAWCALANKTYLKFMSRVEPETDSWYDRPTRTVNTMIRSRFDVGYSDWIGTWGTTG